MMPRACLFGLLLLMTTGCAAGIMRVVPPPTLAITGETLWKMEVEHQGVEQFSGLLALRKEPDGTALVLLDPTGLRLLAGFVPQAGDFRVDECMRPVAATRLPDLVALSVQRVFHPGSGDAAWYEEGEGAERLPVRAETLGPFLLWSVHYRPAAADAPLPAFSSAEMRAPWQGVVVRFEIMR